MFVAFDVNQTREYQLKQHQGPEEPTFVLGVLDTLLASHLLDSKRTYRRSQNPDEPAEISVHLAVNNCETVRFGLKSARNLKEISGKLVTLELKEFSTPVGLRKGLTDASLDYVKPIIDELAEEIERDNTLTENDVKNL